MKPGGYGRGESNVKMTSGILAGIIRGMYLGYGSKRRHLCVCVCVCVVQQGRREDDDRAGEISRVGLSKGHLVTALLEPVLLHCLLLLGRQDPHTLHYSIFLNYS